MDDNVANELGGSVASFDPRYSQAREAVVHETPARLAAVREGERLRAEVERLSGQLAELQRGGGHQAALDFVERELSAAVQAWAEFVGEPEDAGEVGKDLEGYVPLADLLRRNLDTGGELDDRDRAARVDTLNALVRFVCQDGHAHIWLAFKNFLAVVRRTKPECLDGISKSDLALLLGETRAATCDREIRVVERLLKGWGYRGYQLLGGNKSPTTRKRCAAAARGNQNRKRKQ